MEEMVHTSISSSSKRERFVYRVLIVWALFGILAILNDIDLSDLATYFGAFAVYGAAYLGVESWKPSVKPDKESKKNKIDK